MPTTKGLLYSFACEVFHGNISAFFWMEEDLTPEEELMAAKWFPLAGKIATWVLEERLRPDESWEIKSDIETTTGEYVFEVLRRTRMYAQRAHQTLPELSKARWFYYYSCEWLRRTISEFDDLMRRELDNTAFFGAYQEGLGLFNTLRQALDDEMPVLEGTAKSREGAALLKPAGIEFAQLWRKSVEKAVENELSANPKLAGPPHG